MLSNSSFSSIPFCLSEHGASLTVTDKWGRGPLNVAKDNAENPLVKMLTEWLEAHPDQAKGVEAVTLAYKAEDLQHTSMLADQNQSRVVAKNAIFAAMSTVAGTGGGGGPFGGGGLPFGGVKLRKTATVEKSMFTQQKTGTGAATAQSGDTRKALSKLIGTFLLGYFSSRIQFPVAFL